MQLTGRCFYQVCGFSEVSITRKTSNFDHSVAELWEWAYLELGWRISQFRFLYFQTEERLYCTHVVERLLWVKRVQGLLNGMCQKKKNESATKTWTFSFWPWLRTGFQRLVRSFKHGLPCQKISSKLQPFLVLTRQLLNLMKSWGGVWEFSPDEALGTIWKTP